MAKRSNDSGDSSDSSRSSDSSTSSSSNCLSVKQTPKIDSHSESYARKLRGCSVCLISLSKTLIEQACSGGVNNVQKLIADMETDVFRGVNRALPINMSNDSDSSSSSSSSSDDDEIKLSKRTKRTPKKQTKKSESSGSEFEVATKPKAQTRNGNRASRRRRIVQSDDSDKTDVSSDKSHSSVESAQEEESTNIKRKRVKRVKFNDSSDESSRSEDEEPKKGKKRGRKPKVKEENSSPNKGRKNIRKLFTEADLKEETKRANDEEQARVERIAQKQKLYNELIKNEFAAKQQKMKSCILEIDEKTKEVIVEIHPNLCEYLKPHQFDGIKFMWNCLIESVEQLKSGPGSGCILAHSMGLGKTLQVISFVHTLLTNERTSKHISTVAIVCPVNTVRNWTNEFNKWLGDNSIFDFMVFEASDCKTVTERIQLLKLWQKKGGVLIIGIPMFSALICGGRGRKVTKKAKEVFNSSLVDPGPDVVICDEGHLMKNEKTLFNKAVSEVRTLRRAILTGTPLQNNLSEYQVMAQFVKPNLLGTKKEFTNRFVNPITNGQCADSTDQDVMLMKKRVHVLHKLLDGCVQRFDYGVLAPYLQPKCEYVILVQLTETQIKLYQHYLDHFCTRTRFSLLADYNIFRLIWNHPFLLYRSHQIKQERQLFKDDDEEESLKDFICDESEESTPDSRSSSSSRGSSVERKNEKVTRKKDLDESLEVMKKWKTRSRGAAASGDGEGTSKDGSPEVTLLDGEKAPDDNGVNAWFSPFISAEDFNNYQLSGKMIILFSILEECERIGDKVLIFSQSLPLLDLIEDCLAFKMREEKIVPDDNASLEEDITNSWVRNIDYFRIDGSVESTSRKKSIDKFNDPDNLRSRLFLLSTKAGSLGINLVGANRCIIFDASWNPTHDIQAIFRIYRFGQTKPVYVYRFLAQGTMEEKIYDRQVMKQSLSCRVIDEQQVERHFKASDVAELYAFNPDTRTDRPTPMVPKDRLLADILLKHKDYIVSYHEHDSLLENKPEEDLTEEERKAAWAEFEEEKDEEFQRKKREEQRAEFLRQQHLQRQIWMQNVINAQVANAVSQNSGATSVTIGSMSNQSSSHSNSSRENRQNFVRKMFTAKGYPAYHTMTIEDIMSENKMTDIRAGAIRIYQVLNTGLRYCTMELQQIRGLENLRELNADESMRKLELEEGVKNMTIQIRRCQMLASAGQNVHGVTPSVPTGPIPGVGRITISPDDLD